MVLYGLVADPSREKKLAAYGKIIRDANALGLTRLHSVGYDVNNIDILDDLRRRGQLTARLLVATIAAPPILHKQEIKTIEETRRTHHDDWIDAGAVKFWQDGMVELHTAAMLEPYSGAPEVRGAPFWSREELSRAVTELNGRGFKILIHATGDRAAREVLDAYEAARRVNGQKDSVFRIEHAEHVSEADIPRAANLGVIVGTHPSFIDAAWNVQANRLGPERMRAAYPWRSIVAAGGQLTYGSDYPSYTINPWITTQELLTRRHAPEQRLALAEAIQGYTLGAARAGGYEKTEGSIEAGKVADLIIVSQNLFEIDPREIGKTKVIVTMVGGKIVYQAP